MAKIRLTPEQMDTIHDSLHIAQAWWETSRKAAIRENVPALAEYALEKMDEIEDLLIQADRVQRITVRVTRIEAYDVAANDTFG